MLDNSKDESVYTIIMEFAGTTSAAQIRAHSPTESFEKWTSGLLKERAYGVTTSEAERLRRAVATVEIVRVDGLLNVWCTVE